MGASAEHKELRIPGRFKIFVVNLASESARREQITRNLLALGLEFDFFEAVNGAELSDYDLRHYSSEGTISYIGRDLTSSEIGCALSHLYVYSKIIEERLDYAVILEDDVLLLSRFPEILSKLIVDDNPFEIVNFITDSPEIGTKKFVSRKHEITDLPFYSNRTTAYFLSSKAALKLLEVGTPIKTSADGLLGEAALHGLKINGVYPNVATLYPFESTINRGHYSTDKIVKIRKKRSPKFWRGRWYVLKSCLR